MASEKPSPLDALDKLALMASPSTYKQPIGGRATKPGRTSLDVAGALSIGVARSNMDCGQAWGNIAILVATARPVSSVELGDLVDAVIDDVHARIRLQPKHRAALRRRVLYAVLFAELSRQTSPRSVRVVRRKSKRQQAAELEGIDSTRARALAMQMRMVSFAQLEREVRAVVLDRVAAAAHTVGPT